jgi:outer membrane protein TolC
MAGQRSVEQAQLGVARAEIAAALYPLRMEVNEAFFSAFLLQERSREVSILIEDLEARLKLIRAQVRAGAALPGDTAALRAELLRFDQERSELAANRRAALRVLGELTGRGISEAGVLVLPDLAALVASIQRDGEQSRAHPQYALFRAQRERLQREAGLTRARARPQVGAFSQLGYGRPGLKQFTDEFHEYWLAGIQLRWAPWNWGTTQREQEILQLQQRIVDMEEAAFAERLRRQVQDEIEAMQRLQAAIQTDEQIIALRAQVERQARTQLAERAITPAAYVDVRTDLQEARLAQQRHRVELAKARAQYLTTLGIPLQ